MLDFMPHIDFPQHRNDTAPLGSKKATPMPAATISSMMFVNESIAIIDESVALVDRLWQQSDLIGGHDHELPSIRIQTYFPRYEVLIE